MPDVSLHPIGEELWEYSHDIRFCGIWLPHRMTVIRLSDGKLLLHSPTRCDQSTVHALSRIGTIAEIIAPNAFHDLFLEGWLAAVPEARLWIPPRMNGHFPKAPGRVCEMSHDALWGELACVRVEGLPRLNETAFFHTPSKALIIADLLFNIQVHARFATRVAARLGGFYCRLAMPRDMRLGYLRDRQALRQSVCQILNFPFEKIILGHGTNILTDGRTDFRHSLQWLLDDSE